jgi:sugar phosphate isomerase/epimerase
MEVNMRESIKKYMKVGLIHFMAYPATMKGEGPIEETIKKIAVDDYFDAIEITWIKDAVVRENVKKMLDSSHMTVAYGGQPRLLTTGMNINDLDEDKRVEAVTSLKAGIDEAYQMGAAGFGFLSGKYIEASKEQSYQALIKSTKELCSYAKSKGKLKVALEVFDYDIDKKSLIGPVGIAERFAKDITLEFDNFGLMVDLSHIPMIHETIEENLLPIKEYIIHAHMGNTVIKDSSCEAYGDTHPRFGFPNSENDVDELVTYLRTLIQIGFISEERRPIVSFEVKPFGDEDSDIVIANAKRVLNLAWAKV